MAEQITTTLTGSYETVAIDPLFDDGPAAMIEWPGDVPSFRLCSGDFKFHDESTTLSG